MKVYGAILSKQVGREEGRLAIRSMNNEMVMKDNDNTPIFCQNCLNQGQKKKKKTK